MTVLWHHTLFHDFICGVVFETCDKVNLVFGQGSEPLIVRIATIHYEDGAGFKTEGARYGDFVLAPWGNHSKRRQVALMLQDQMQLDGSLGAAKLGPVKDGGTQLNGRGIYGEQLVLEAQLSALALVLD